VNEKVLSCVSGSCLSLESVESNKIGESILSLLVVEANESRSGVSGLRFRRRGK